VAAESESRAQAPCELLEWDSEHFGFPIAKVVAHTLTESSVDEIDAWCIDQGIRCLYFVAGPDDSETSRLAAAGGFQVVDVRITTRRSYEGLLDLDHGPEEVTIREATDADLKYARQLAARSHRISRFYFDGRFPKDRCDALYEAWVERAARDPERRLFIPVVDGEPVGYYVLPPVGPDAEGHGELVAIDERHRGKGWARAMYFGVYEQLAARGVRTQRGAYSYRNLTAIRLHEKIGFRIAEVQVWHHKWYA
jgi:ribosomal protein S18 acetylase RimI-like enzyme